jgi:hypothetical protein
MPLLLLIVVAVSSSLAQELPIRVGVYNNNPKVFRDASGRVAGFFPEILESIAKAEGWRLEYVEGAWSECLERLETGEIDLMVDVAWSEERAAKYDFNEESVFVNWGELYSTPGVRAESFLDLAGRRIAVMKGNIHTDGKDGIRAVLARFGVEATFVEVDDLDQVFARLDAGDAEVGVVNRLFGSLHRGKHQVTRSPIIFNPNHLRFAMPRGAPRNEKLIARLDHHLRELKRDETSEYHRIIGRHLGLPMQGGLEMEAVRRYVWRTILVAAIVILLIVAWNYRLKREILFRREVERQLAEHHHELELANKRLRELDQLKSMFMASMSHELRTPLNSIIGFTGLLLMDLAGPVNEEQRKQLGMVRSSAEHLLNLINEILDISKIEAGRIQLEPVAIEARELVEEVVNSVAPLAAKKNLSLAVEAPEEIRIRADRRRLKQVLINIVGNAIKFTETGGVTIRARREAGRAAIEIDDTGPGIRAEDLPLLFQPFQQIDMSTTKRYEGTGLGLYLCRKIMTLLGGTIEASSEVGRGSRFTIGLPLNAEKGATP